MIYCLWVNKNQCIAFWCNKTVQQQHRLIAPFKQDIRDGLLLVRNMHTHTQTSPHPAATATFFSGFAKFAFLRRKCLWATASFASQCQCTVRRFKRINERTGLTRLGNKGGEGGGRAEGEGCWNAVGGRMQTFSFCQGNERTASEERR